MRANIWDQAIIFIEVKTFSRLGMLSANFDHLVIFLSLKQDPTMDITNYVKLTFY